MSRRTRTVETGAHAHADDGRTVEAHARFNEGEPTPPTEPRQGQPVPEIIPIGAEPDYSTLPPGVTHPTGHRTTKTSAMSVQRLKARIDSYNGITWIDSPEYAETVYRLQTQTVSQLEASGQVIPQWKVSA